MRALLLYLKASLYASLCAAVVLGIYFFVFALLQGDSRGAPAFAFIGFFYSFIVTFFVCVTWGSISYNILKLLRFDNCISIAIVGVLSSNFIYNYFFSVRDVESLIVILCLGLSASVIFYSVIDKHHRNES